MIKRFVSDDGVEVAAVTANQVQGVDRVAPEEIGPKLLQIM